MFKYVFIEKITYYSSTEADTSTFSKEVLIGGFKIDS